MFGRRPVAPSNEAVAVIPVFTADPHGAALFAGSLAGGIGGGRPVIDDRVSQAWHGPTQSPQQFRGAGGSLGGGRPVVPQGTTLDQERGLSADPARSIFEQRAAARRFS
jgi:hypothetical protein